MEETYKKNLLLFKKYSASFAKEIEKISLDDFQIDMKDNDISDIKYQNESLYPAYPNVSAAMQVNAFKNKPKSYSMLPARMDGEVGDIHDKYVNKLEKASPALNKDFTYTHTGVHIHNNQIPLLLVSGCGAGYHIQQLIEEYDIFNLIIYDEDYSFIKLSMHLIDWTPIFKYFNKPYYTLSFCCHKDPQMLSRFILQKIMETNQILATVIYFFQHLSNEFLNNILEKVLEEGYLMVQGWGFYDDEVISLNNTLSNIKSGHPIFTAKHLDNKMCNIPLFIVASGPSIDDDIEFIKENQDKAIICSAGSALSILNNHGIKPTFHFEIERGPSAKYDVGGTYEKLVDSNFHPEYLKETNFIGLSVLYPEVFELFKNTYLFFRTHDCGSAAVKDDIVKLSITNPSVTNAVVSFSALLKFKNTYLFGLDGGYIDPEQHHSKDSLYYKHSPKHLENIDITIFKEVPANFGGKVKTDMKLSWIRDRIESAYQMKDTRSNVYNCSNGAKIKFTEPLHSYDISLKKTYTLDQKEQAFLKHFQKFTLEDIIEGESITDLISIVLVNVRVLKTLCEKYMHTIKEKDLYIIIQGLQEYIGNSAHQGTKSLIGGTIRVLSSFAYMHTMASDKIEENDFYSKFFLKTLHEFLEFVDADLTEKFL